jgi:hypothetical protein
MPKLNITVPHRLTQDEALKRIRSAFNDAKTRYAGQIGGLQEEWAGYTGKVSVSVRGLSLSAALTVKPSQVEISGNLPLVAVFLKGKIKSAIEENFTKLLA